MLHKRKKHTVFMQTAVCAVYIIILILAICLDLAYQEKISIFSDFMHIIAENGRRIGLSYTKAFDLLDKNFGILFTVISITLTMNVNIANRLENRICGIPLGELYFQGISEMFRYVRNIAVFSPVIIIFAINLKFCIAGYTILIFAFISVIQTYFMYNRSYDGDKGRKIAAKKLVECFEPSTAEWGSSKCHVLLENIHTGMRNEKTWRNEELLYEELVRKAIKCSEDKCFALSYLYYKMVFADEGFMPHVFRKYLMAFDDQLVSLKNDTEETKKLYIVFWSVLCAVFEDVKENELSELFEILFSEFPERSSHAVLRNGRATPMEVLGAQAEFLVVWTECWIEQHEIETENFIHWLPLIWDNARKISDEKHWKGIDSCVQLYGDVGKNVSVMRKKIQYICDDYERGAEKTNIYGIIKSITDRREDKR